MNGSTRLRTHSGRLVSLLDPDPSDILIEDIAHALSHLCRFTGHTTGFYSVAQHSLLVSAFSDAEDTLWGLLHDAPEAYLSDVSAPLKMCGALVDYRVIEERLMACIAQKFGLAPEMPDSVRMADKRALATEFRDLTTANDLQWIAAECGVPHPFYAIQIHPWGPGAAKDIFLRRFKELTHDAR